jgi:lipoate-protein ligase A
MVDDCKVAGAAQRRSRRGLLQQGSIQNVPVSDEFREYFIAELSGSSVIGAIDSAVLGQAQQLAEAKYGTEEWLHRV